jgi:hypothetical protein
MSKRMHAASQCSVLDSTVPLVVGDGTTGVMSQCMHAASQCSVLDSMVPLVGDGTADSHAPVCCPRFIFEQRFELFRGCFEVPGVPSFSFAILHD